MEAIGILRRCMFEKTGVKSLAEIAENEVPQAYSIAEVGHAAAGVIPSP